jgi:hypothetical protein
VTELTLTGEQEKGLAPIFAAIDGGAKYGAWMCPEIAACVGDTLTIGQYIFPVFEWENCPRPSVDAEGNYHSDIWFYSIEANGYPDAKRHLEYQYQEADAGRDLDGTGPFAVQAKCWKRTPSIDAILEIKAQGEYICPVAFLKRTRSAKASTLEVVAMPPEAFFFFARELMRDDEMRARFESYMRGESK